MKETNLTSTVLVTGGAGFIGSHACKVLSANGYLPVVVDNLSRGFREAVRWGPLELCDIGDRLAVRAVLERHRPVAVVHFAAFAYVGESVDKPLLYYSNNAGASVEFLQTLIEYQPLPVVFSSTCATYGVPERNPIPEDHPQRPINPYGFSKLFVERVLADLGRSSGLPWVALRYFNAAGSSPDGEIGEMHDPETHLIPLVLRSAISGIPLQIFGTDYDTSDGTCIRDYVHVMDLADAHVLAVKYLLEGGKSRAFNLANARGYSVKEVIATAEKVCGRSIPIQYAPRRPGDPPALIGEQGAARDILRWQPLRSELGIQIKDAWNWVSTR